MGSSGMERTLPQDLLSPILPMPLLCSGPGSPGRCTPSVEDTCAVCATVLSTAAIPVAKWPVEPATARGYCTGCRALSTCVVSRVIVTVSVIIAAGDLQVVPDLARGLTPRGE